MSAPSSRTCPAVGAKEPMSSRTSVVLPAPDGPAIPNASPGASRKLT